MKIKLSELRPGMYVWPPTSKAEPAVLELDAMQVHTVRLQLDGVKWESRWAQTDHARPVDQEIVVTSPPPRVLMSWDENSGYWAILIDTTNGSGHSKLNIALNDAELFDGASDPEEPEPEPRMVSAGIYRGSETNVLGPGGFYYPRCPECGGAQTADHMAEVHGGEGE